MSAGAPDRLETLLKTRLRLTWRGVQLALDAPHSVFSNTWIDKGTLLLLDHLPETEPRTFLDLGCGYGALGLAVAAALPASRGLLVDRDLLAVSFTRRNVISQRIRNVSVVGSLGYRDISPAWGPFDWILSNFPARAGDRVFGHFLTEGTRRLAPGGEMRVVVIAPLADALVRTAEACGIPSSKVAGSSQHAVFAFKVAEKPAVDCDDGLYERDRIELELPPLDHPLRLVRPTDLADEPHRLEESVPFLAESLPSSLPDGSRVLVFRCGYGLLAALTLERYARSSVVAVDRDLLGTEFTRRNCVGSKDRLRVIEAVGLDEAVQAGPFRLAVGELLPPLGLAATREELERITSLLAPGGLALVAGLKKQWRELEEAQLPDAEWRTVRQGKTVSVRASHAPA